MLEHMSMEEWRALPGNKPKRKAPENKVKAACMHWLMVHNILHNRQQSGKLKVINPITNKAYWVMLAEKGSGDIVGSTRKGRYFEIETKPPKGGKWEEDQQKRKAKVEASGGIYILARSTDALHCLLTL